MASMDTENLKNDASTTQSVPIYSAASRQHCHTCDDPSHHHDHSFLFDQNDEGSSAGAAKRQNVTRKKVRKNQKQDVTRSEAIPGHQGDKNIDDLLLFINGPSTASNGTNVKKAQKNATKPN